MESCLVGHDPEEEQFEITLPEPKSKRGPKKLPVMWSRVISIREEDDEDIGVFNIEFDLLELQRRPKPLPKRRQDEWAPIYQP